MRRHLDGDKSSYYVELKTDGTFYESKNNMSGKYQISGDDLSMVIPDGETWRVKLNNDVIDDAGEEWVKK